MRVSTSIVAALALAVGVQAAPAPKKGNCMCIPISMYWLLYTDPTNPQSLAPGTPGVPSTGDTLFQGIATLLNFASAFDPNLASSLGPILGGGIVPIASGNALTIPSGSTIPTGSNTTTNESTSNNATNAAT